MFSWLKSHWKGVATLLVAAVVFTAVTVLTGGLGAPLLVSLAAGGFASGVAGYVTGELLEGRTPSVRESLVQGTIAAVVTVGTLGVGRVLAPVVSRILPRVSASAVPLVVRTTATNTTVGAAFGSAFKVGENAWRGRPLLEDVDDAAIMGGLNGLLMEPSNRLGQRLASTLLPRPKAPTEPTVRPVEEPARVVTPEQPTPALQDSRGNWVGMGGVEPPSPITGASRESLDSWNQVIQQVRQAAPRVLTEQELAALSAGRGSPSHTIANGAGDAAASFDAAARRVNDLVRAGEDISVARMQQLNAMLLENTENAAKAGVLRDRTGDWAGHEGPRPFLYANPELVPAYLDDFMQWYRSARATLPPTELAAQAYQQLVRIHPFSDSNGRTTRLVMDWILQRNGLPPTSWTGLSHNAVHVPTDWVVYNVDQAVLQSNQALTRTIDASARPGVVLSVPTPPPPASRSRGVVGALGTN